MTEPKKGSTEQLCEKNHIMRKFLPINQMAASIMRGARVKAIRNGSTNRRGSRKPMSPKWDVRICQRAEISMHDDANQNFIGMKLHPKAAEQQSGEHR